MDECQRQYTVAQLSFQSALTRFRTAAEVFFSQFIVNIFDKTVVKL